MPAIALNSLNYDSSTHTIDFSFQGSQGDEIASLTGRVPLIIPTESDTREMAKEAVRQLLQEALEALGPQPLP